MTNTTKHTPGPWSAYQARRSGEPVLIWFAGPNVAIAEIKSTGRTSENEANARLIAAAPDMLEALETLANVFPYFPAGSEERAALVKAQAAITKARG